MTKIVIFMQGGLIENIVSDEGTPADVYVVDYDTDGVGEDHPHLTKINGTLCLLSPHEVDHAPATVSLVQKTWETV